MMCSHQAASCHEQAMGKRLFRYSEPTFCSGLLDDPILLVHMRPLGKSLLFDCGQIHHLAKRVLKSVTAIFVTHAHMDHFMGFDTFVRHNHVSPKTVDLYGPPGIARKVEVKLSGYDWNLTEPYWCTFRVHEIFPDQTKSFLFPGPEGFPCRFEGEQSRPDRVIFRNEFLQVEADLCDHKIPALMFRITERPSFMVDGGKLEKAGLAKGDWLRVLKKRFYGDMMDSEPLAITRRRGDAVMEEPVVDATGLYETIRREHIPASIGYLTDIGFSRENRNKVLSLMEGVTLLACECSFLAEDLDKARVSHHLCTTDLNALMKELNPRLVLPMHLSKTYLGRSHILYGQLEIPKEVTLIRLPEHLTPRPLLTCEMPKLWQFSRTC